MKYRVLIQEVTTTEYEVEADNPEEAQERAEEMREEGAPYVSQRCSESESEVRLAE